MKATTANACKFTLDKEDAMATTEERMKILKMIEEGKVSAEEGAKLLAALASANRPSGGLSASGAKWLRVRVTDVNSGRSKATVQIPISLMEAGMKIGAHFAPEIDGVNMDQLVEALRTGMTGKIIDVTDDEDGEHVEIFVE
jgi:hypothetical protein